MIRKTVVITGASGGIGSATALKFAEKGYNVGLTYNSNNPVDLIEKIKSFGVDCLAIHVNLLDEKQINYSFAKFYDYFKTLEAVVCCAGVAEDEKMLIDKNFEEISNIIDINLKGTILVNREASKIFIKQKHGAIVNVSSILGKVGCACEGVYSAAKAGVNGLTKALSKELGMFNVRVNAVAPGMIETKMTAVFNEKEKDVLKNQTSLQRLGSSLDVANLIYFLSSDESSFITGECIEVSGGLLI